LKIELFRKSYRGIEIMQGVYAIAYFPESTERDISASRWCYELELLLLVEIDDRCVELAPRTCRSRPGASCATLAASISPASARALACWYSAAINVLREKARSGFEKASPV
jgi:hypothetical protein